MTPAVAPLVTGQVLPALQAAENRRDLGARTRLAKPVNRSWAISVGDSAVENTAGIEPNRPAGVRNHNHTSCRVWPNKACDSRSDSAKWLAELAIRRTLECFGTPSWWIGWPNGAVAEWSKAPVLLNRRTGHSVPQVRILSAPLVKRTRGPFVDAGESGNFFHMTR